MADTKKRQEEGKRIDERMERIRQYNEDTLLHRFDSRTWCCPPHCPPNCPMLSYAQIQTNTKLFPQNNGHLEISGCLLFCF